MEIPLWIYYTKYNIMKNDHFMIVAREKLSRHGGRSIMVVGSRFPGNGKLLNMYYLERKEVCHG